MNDKSLIIITGCDSGIGKNLCELLSAHNYIIAASFLKKNPFEQKKNIFARQLDMRKAGQTGQFAAFVKKLCKDHSCAVEALINNAGIASFGPVENLPLRVYREIFEINYFGVVELTQAFIPLLIESRGKILIISSTAARVAVPFASPYASSKFAVEGFADSLRREMIPYGIRTVVIEPAGVATPIWRNSWQRVKQEYFPFFAKKYLRIFESIGKRIVSGADKGLSSKKAALKIYKIIKKPKPKARYLIAKSFLREYIKTHIPSRLIDAALPRLLHMDYGKRTSGQTVDSQAGRKKHPYI
ncbi:MAG: SDR family NAD(P)-dependent oxidoreductase [Spirochaetales bacterium]|nr:SDR family NAD(P)-dependent oxidoreductase [Spirochaetales bacterium]